MKARPKHLVIPDTQVKPGVPTNHLTWIGKYIVDKKPDVIVHIGDHYDMHSLSVYDMGKKAHEGARYEADIEAGNKAMDVLMKPINDYNAQRRKNKEKLYKPRKVFCIGNHEERIMRHVNSYPILEGRLSYDDFNLKQHGWEVHDFRVPVVIDGISYAHYFYAHNSGRPFGGTAHNKLMKIGHSFTMGHQQGFDIATRTLDNGDQQWGCVAGSCYQHDEGYRGPQANKHWHGLVVKHNVNNGNYSPMIIDLDYLRQRYS